MREMRTDRVNRAGKGFVPLPQQSDIPQSARGAIITVVADGLALEAQRKRATTQGFEFFCDEGQRMGGANAHPSPLGYFVGAATMCLLTQVKLFGAMRKIGIDHAECHAEFDFTRYGSVLAGTVVGIPKAFRSHLTIESSAPLNDVKAVIRLAKQGCFIEQLISRALPIEATYTVNGSSIDLS